MKLALLLTLTTSALVPACLTSAPQGDVEDGEFDVAGGKADSPSGTDLVAILALVNTADLSDLDNRVGLSSSVASAIVAHRDGQDRAAGTADDNLFDDLAELDAVPHVGPRVLKALGDFVRRASVLTLPAQGLECTFRDSWINSTTAEAHQIPTPHLGNLEFTIQQTGPTTLKFVYTDLTTEHATPFSSSFTTPYHRRMQAQVPGFISQMDDLDLQSVSVAASPTQQWVAYFTNFSFSSRAPVIVSFDCVVR